MTNGNGEIGLDDLENPEALVLDHEHELLDHQSRIDHLEDRLEQVFPIANTPAGATQRFLLEVPHPRTVFAMGAIGNDTDYSRAVGPGGFGLETTQSLGVHVGTRTCIDTDGLTVVHSGGAVRLLTRTDFGLASSGALCIGTNEGPIEISAGSVVVPDPDFTVVPSRSIPEAPPTVDTATPRSGVETAESVWDSVWYGARNAAWGFQRWQARGGTVSAPSIAPRAARITRSVLSSLSAWRAAIQAAIGVVEAAASRLGADTAVFGPSSVRIHADGGVRIGTPAAAEMFGGVKVGCSSPVKAELRGGVSAAVYSMVSASCYGVAGAKLKSEGVAEVSGRYVVAKGSYCDIQARTSAGLTSAGDATVQAARQVMLHAPVVCLTADHFVVGVNETADIRSQQDVVSHAGRTNTVKSDQRLELEGGQEAELKVNRTRVKLRNDNIELAPGAGDKLTVDRHSFSYGNIIRSARSGTTIRGRCNLG